VVPYKEEVEIDWRSYARYTAPGEIISRWKEKKDPIVS
jgi:hypothetical protein